MESGGGVRLSRTKDPVDDALGELIGSMLTISRLDNIISEIGDKIEPDPLRLSNTVVLDAIEEAKDDEESIIHKASKSKIGKVQKKLAVTFMEQVKEHMHW